MKILMIRHPKTETEKRELEALSEKAEAFQRTYLRGKRTALVTAPEACCQRTLEVLTARRSGIPFAVTGRTAAEGFRERAGESPKAREARVEREFKGILFRLAAGGRLPPEVRVLSGHESTLLAIQRGFSRGRMPLWTPQRGPGSRRTLFYTPCRVFYGLKAAYRRHFQTSPRDFPPRGSCSFARSTFWKTEGGEWQC